jgi:hypothetical protein
MTVYDTQAGQAQGTVYLYGYTLPLNPTKAIQSLAISNDNAIKILAIDEVNPAQQTFPSSVVIRDPKRPVPVPAPVLRDPGPGAGAGFAAVGGGIAGASGSSSTDAARVATAIDSLVAPGPSARRGGIRPGLGSSLSVFLGTIGSLAGGPPLPTAIAIGTVDLPTMPVVDWLHPRASSKHLAGETGAAAPP